MTKKGEGKDLFFHPWHEENSIKQACFEYLEFIQKRGLNPHTLRHIQGSLRLFVCWLMARRITGLFGINRDDLEAYQRWLTDAPLGRKDDLQAPSTIQGRLLAVRSLFRWLTKNNLILENPASGWDIAKRPPKALPTCLSESQINDLFEVPDIETPRGLRDRAILETFYSSAIRRGELVALNRNDLNRSDGILKIRKGKGNKQRLVPIGDRAIHWIDLYLKHGRPFLKGSNHHALFLNHRGKRLGPQGVNQTFAKLKHQVGIKMWGNVHLLRHACATHMLKHGADIRIIQEILGHVETETTLIYTHLDIQALKEIHQKTHPAERDKPDGSLF